ncbi:Zinc finger, RING-type [Corchorus olitorius]|uniref:Zinc finger, RING-type n=1 Tax=Corchorus olitorius TaxID=93759 RepID=A0A1R3JME7_9ROSI|nr:Zinc finger, RING-type [Corchorus olitorius]
MPCSSGTELLSKEVDVGDSSVKLLNSNSSVGHRHYNLGRSIFLKRSRHYYGHHYSRRNSGNHANPSTSRGKISPLNDERLSFKFAQYNPEAGQHGDGREKAFNRPERIRSSSLVLDSVSIDKFKMVCGACQKHLRRKPYLLGNAIASGEASVVAVLVCGHVYHADCLETRTSDEDRRDPPCPLCSGSESQA